MAIYLYQSPKTKEIVEVVQKMNDKHEYSEGGVQWKRVWTKPRMGVDTVKIDPFSSKDFVKATNKPGKIGDLWERSAEMSQRRIDKDGKDHIKEKHYADYRKTHKGNLHPKEKEEKGLKKLADQGIMVDWGND